MEDLAAGIDTTLATDVSIERDLHGPWLCMAENFPAMLSGELFVEKDGFVFFRPGSGLGYGLGKLRVAKADSNTLGTAFLMDMEVFHYDVKAAVVPAESTTVRMSGVVNRVQSKSTHYTTLSFLGAWEHRSGPKPAPSAEGERTPKEAGATGKGSVEEENSIFAGAFNAAKVMPWSPSRTGGTSSEEGKESSGDTWKPNPQVREAFQHVFPTPLELTSHIRRRKKEHRETHDGELGSLQHYNIAGHRVGPLSDVFYIPDYITEEEEGQIVQCVQQTPDAFKSKLEKRTCQEWGCSMCEACQQSFVADTNMPRWVEQVTDVLVHDGLFSPAIFPNSVRIHEYGKTDGIGPHVDGPIYVPLVTVLSAASTSVMQFFPRVGAPYADPMEHYKDTFRFKDGTIGSQSPLISVVLEPRSLLIFRGDVYYHHPHGIPDDEVIDLTSKSASGEVVNRRLLKNGDIKEVRKQYRVSITTRHLLPRCAHQPRRAEYGMKRAWYLYNQLPVPDPLFPDVSEVTAESRSTAASQESGPSSISSPDIGRLEEKLDRLLRGQEAMREELHHVKELLGTLAASTTQFQTETSGILNHVTSTLLRVESSAEDTLELMENINKKSPNGNSNQ